MNQASTPTRQLVILDSRVNNWQSLADDVGTNTAVLILDSSADGLMQISDYLATTGGQDFTPLQNIHIISHGSSGSLLLGSTTLTASNLSLYSRQLATLGDALAENGDILLYGCNVAADQAGLQFINQLADLTQADVAASNDITGSTLLGGDWRLEIATGAIEPSLILSAATLNDYTGILPVGGIVTTDLGGTDDRAYSVAVQADGKILLGGYTGDGSSSVYGSGTYYDFALVRYNSDGSLDTSFDSDGKVTTTVGSHFDKGQSVTLQTDGKILLGGYSDSLRGTSDYSYYSNDFSLVRYNSNGSLDTGFDSDGKISISVNGAYGWGKSVTVQADGKILLGGYRNNDFALMRFNINGSLDTSFDNDGELITDLGNSTDFGMSVTIQADGKILLGGRIYTGVWGSSYSSDFALVRYNNDGSLDTSFDSDGKVITDLGNSYEGGESVTVQADSKILLGGHTGESSGNYNFALVRYNSDGSLDTSFDSDGKVTTDLSVYDDPGYSLTMQPDGKILLTGGAVDFDLARYNSDGSLDTSFDSDGKVTTAVGIYADTGNSVAVQADGKILLGGVSSNNANDTDLDFALVRYNSDGSLDTSFGPDTTGPTVTTFSPADESAGAGVSDNIVITFDKAIQKAAGNIVLTTAAGRAVETFKIASSTAISISGDTLTINPTKDLSYETGYKLKIASGAITDTAGNAYTGLTSYNFTTTDTLTTSASNYTLTAKDPKKLAYSGTGDFTGTGNRLANAITGGSGNDVLNGAAGKDSLTGGTGADKFVFNLKPDKTNIDTITDFTAGTDKIVLDHAIFKKLSSALTSNQLVSGTAAIDSNDYLIYNATSGRLFYDADGSGKGKAVEIAVIGTSLNLAADDFVIN